VETRLEQEISLLHDRICQGIGDPKRILILYELYRSPRCVNSLVETLGLPQSTVSRHLKILRERSLVLTERDGTTVTYSIADTRIIDALNIMRDVLANILKHEVRLAEFTALDEA
jgi:ArsR family transcriptional regulator